VAQAVVVVQAAVDSAADSAAVLALAPTALADKILAAAVLLALKAVPAPVLMAVADAAAVVPEELKVGQVAVDLAAARVVA